MDKDKLNAGLEGLRAATRPAIILALLIGSFVFINEGTTGMYADWWVKLTVASAGEWVLERPITKVIKGLKKDEA